MIFHKYIVLLLGLEEQTVLNGHLIMMKKSILLKIFFEII